MSGRIEVEGISKLFPRFHADKPMTIQEVFQRGLGRLRPAEFFWALDDISFTVEPGRMVGILGFNGAGKSTLLRLVAGVGRPDRGRVALHGRIGAILDLGVGFHPELTGRENIYVSGVTSGLTRREVAACFDSIIAFSELDEFVDNPLRTGGAAAVLIASVFFCVHLLPGSPNPVVMPAQAADCTHYDLSAVLLNVRRSPGKPGGYIDVLEQGDVACVTQKRRVGDNDWVFIATKTAKSGGTVEVGGACRSD